MLSRNFSLVIQDLPYGLTEMKIDKALTQQELADSFASTRVLVESSK